MSLPQRPLLPTVAGMDDKTPRLGQFPPFLCATSSPSSLFPQMMTPNNFNIYAQLLMQMQQQQQHQQQFQMQQQHRLSAGTSPVNSDQASSRSESPMSKKLVLDEDGCVTCPVCSSKVLESEWNSHIDQEKERLITHIATTKDRGQSVSSSSIEQKRDNELSRVKANQQKRQMLKRGGAPIIRDCLTPFSRQSNDETGSSESPDTKKDEENFGVIKCSSCQQQCAYAIIMSSFDRPKCQSCFDSVRTRGGVSSATSPEAPVLDIESSTDGSPTAKKIKLDTIA